MQASKYLNFPRSLAFHFRLERMQKALEKTARLVSRLPPLLNITHLVFSAASDHQQMKSSILCVESVCRQYSACPVS